MPNDDLGDRMKRYENVTRYHLPPKQAVAIRIDGRAFHTYTRGMHKPFDQNLMDAMSYATTMTSKDMSGFRLAYTQSDEATFLITDFDEFATQGWFDYNLSKIISLSASLFTAHFNAYMTEINVTGSNGIATFDSRAFVIPIEDAPNLFLWRQKDWYRNSVQMLGQAHFSHKQLHGKKLADIHDMLIDQAGVNWAKDCTPAEKNGVFIRRVLEDQATIEIEIDDLGREVKIVGPSVWRTTYQRISERADYSMIKDWINPPLDDPNL